MGILPTATPKAPPRNHLQEEIRVNLHKEEDGKGKSATYVQYQLKKKRSSAKRMSGVRGAAIFLATSVSLIQGAISGSFVSGSQ